MPLLSQDAADDVEGFCVIGVLIEQRTRQVIRGSELAALIGRIRSLGPAIYRGNSSSS